jgi:hypothetical protein
MKRTAFLIWCVAALTLPLTAQTFYGSIVGSVTDATGGAVPQAGVTLTNLGTGERRNMATDGVGNYQFVNLVPGQYKVEVEKAGFRRFAREPITVEVQSAVRIDVAMQVGEVTQTIEVSVQTPLLQTETSTLGQVVEGRKVLELPLNGRNIFSLVAWFPASSRAGSRGLPPRAPIPSLGGTTRSAAASPTKAPPTSTELR